MLNALRHQLPIIKPQVCQRESFGLDNNCYTRCEIINAKLKKFVIYYQ